VVPFKEEGSFPETHHKMHNSIILTNTYVRTSSENKPIPVIISLCQEEDDTFGFVRRDH